MGVLNQTDSILITNKADAITISSGNQIKIVQQVQTDVIVTDEADEIVTEFGDLIEVAYPDDVIVTDQEDEIVTEFGEQIKAV